jgi:hypothetical protein
MTNRYLTHPIFFCFMLLVFAGPAGADIVQCVDEAGMVTYTDVPCKKGVDAAQVSALGNRSTVKLRVASTVGTLAVARVSRDGAWTKAGTGNRRVGLDMETMKAARSTMLMMDRTSSLSHQQNLVALDLRNQRWFDFR